MKCACNKVRRQLVVYGTESDLPEDLRRKLSDCPACREFWSETRRVSGLIGLKRFETPDDLALLRCRSAVRRNLSEIQRSTAWGGLWNAAWPALRFGLAALFVGLLSWHVWSPPRVALLDAAEYDVAPVNEEPELVHFRIADERPNPEFSPMWVSNWMPQVQHRGGAFQLIGHEP